MDATPAQAKTSLVILEKAIPFYVPDLKERVVCLQTVADSLRISLTPALPDFGGDYRDGSQKGDDSGGLMDQPRRPKRSPPKAPISPLAELLQNLYAKTGDDPKLRDCSLGQIIGAPKAKIDLASALAKAVIDEKFPTDPGKLIGLKEELMKLVPNWILAGWPTSTS